MIQPARIELGVDQWAVRLKQPLRLERLVNILAAGAEVDGAVDVGDLPTHHSCQAHAQTFN
jgi:hypothetical protein